MSQVTFTCLNRKRILGILFLLPVIFFYLFTGNTWLKLINEDKIIHYKTKWFTNTINEAFLNVTKDSNKPKRILFYTPFWRSKDYRFGVGQEPFKRYGCPVSNCQIYSDKNALKSITEFDALIFHTANHNSFVPFRDKRSPYQRFIMFELESPRFWKYSFTKYNNFFNWTMTYRSDSDVPIPYGWVLGDLEPYKEVDKSTVVKKYKHILRDKDKMVAWIASKECNSDSKRELYINEMKKYINVGMMGKCGSIPCDMADHLSEGDNCTLSVNTRYKFYLAFENAICDEYVTEKLFRRLQLNAVLIVMGGVDYSQYAPPHSFINVNNFNSPRELVTYLNYLDEHDDEYLTYFWWKDHYNSTAIMYDKHAWAKAFCSLCEKLNEKEQIRKVYRDMSAWWKNKTRCKTDHPWAKYTITHTNAVK